MEEEAQEWEEGAVGDSEAAEWASAALEEGEAAAEEEEEAVGRRRLCRPRSKSLLAADASRAESARLSSRTRPSCAHTRRPRVARAVGLLGDRNGRTQHTSAFVWRRCFALAGGRRRGDCLEIRGCDDLRNDGNSLFPSSHAFPRLACGLICKVGEHRPSAAGEGEAEGEGSASRRHRLRSCRPSRLRRPLCECPPASSSLTAGSATAARPPPP